MLQPVFNLIAGDGIEAIDGRQVALASELFVMLDSANAPGGVVQLNSEGVLEVNSWSIASDTPAAINPTIPQLGEILLKGKTLVVGDDETAGGIPCNLAAENCVFVAADGDAEHNDAALRAALAEAASLTPYGSAASPTNMRWLIVGPGTYPLPANALGHLVVPSFLGIMALVPGTVRIVTDADSKLILRQAANDADHVSALRGVELVGVDSLRFDFASDTTGTGFGFLIDFRQVRFTGLNDTQSTMQLYAGNLSTLNGKHSPKIAGYVIDCHSTGRNFFGNHGSTNSSTPFTYDIRFENCTAAGHRSFGSSSSIPIVSTVGLLQGTHAALINCRMGGSTTENWSCVLNCEMRGCHWNGAIQRVDSSARIAFSTIRGVVSSNSITNNSAVNARIHHCLIAGNIGANVTNLLGSLSDASIAQDSDA